jgi:hypothetical protein
MEEIVNPGVELLETQRLPNYPKTNQGRRIDG